MGYNARRMKRLMAYIPALVTEYLAMAIALAVLVIYFGVRAENFLTKTTFFTIAAQVPHISIVVVGMTFALIIGGIDLSVGSVLAVSGAVMSVCIVKGSWPLPAAIAAAMGVGAACGWINGCVIVRWRLPSFIVTLGMLEIARGATYHITDSRTVYIGPSIERIAEASVLGLPLPFVVALATVIAGQVVLSRTVFGRRLVAIGTNEEALRLSGIDPKPYKVAVFTLCGLCSALAAVMHTARFTALDPNTGSGLELAAIAAVVIGGTSLMGGRGSVAASFFGVLIIAVLDAGLSQIDAREPTKRIITGCVIVTAVILDYYRQKARRTG